MKYPPADVMRHIRLYLFALLSLVWINNAYAAGEWAWVADAIHAGNEVAVAGLSNQERIILLATIALKSDQPNSALKLLLRARDSKDPLVALLEAEAYRQQAIQAMRESGMDGLAGQKHLLESANLNHGLGEAEARLNAVISNLRSVKGTPLDILLPGKNMANVFLFDKARNRLFVFESNGFGSLKKVTDEYVVTGSIQGDKKHQGDGKTPHGVYHFIKKLQGKNLASRYGPVAFPIDYPNGLDKLHQKNGSGIWLHGYPLDVNRRPPQDTRGCFSLNNTRLMQMAKHVKLNRSWVIVGENFVFGQNEMKQQILSSVLRDLEAWRSDWVSLDSRAYLSHYHQKFRSGKRGLAAWKRHKAKLNASKTFVDVTFSDMTLIRDPNPWPEGEVVVAELHQTYRSSNYEDHGRKRIYLARANADHAWQILLEESLSQ